MKSIKNIISVGLISTALLGISHEALAKTNPLLSDNPDTSRYVICKLQQCATRQRVIVGGSGEASYENCIQHNVSATTKLCKKLYQTMITCAKKHGKNAYQHLTIDELTNQKTLKYIGGAQTISDMYEQQCRIEAYHRHQADQQKIKAFYAKYNH